MKKTLLLILVLISLLILGFRFGAQSVAEMLGIQEKSGIRVLSIPEEARVFINGQEVGKTPYENTELTNKEITVKIQKDDLFWEGRVRLNGSTLTVVNRELSKDLASSAGEVLNLEKGTGVTIISTPSDADIEIDGKFYGKSPLTQKLPVGEHVFSVSKGNYLKRSIRAYLPDNFNLTIAVDLALSEADLTNIPTPVTTATPKVRVKSTPVGFLRVREKATTASREIGRVSPGDELVLLEELTGWFRIRLSDNSEGFISSTYAETLNQ